MTTLQNTYKDLFNVEAFEANLKKFFDVDAAKEAFENLFDAESAQEALAKFYDLDAAKEAFENLFDAEAAKEAMAKFYDVEAIQENLKSVYDVEAVKEAFEKLSDNDVVAYIKEALEKAVDQEAIVKAVEKGVALNSNLVATNTHAISDAVVLQATRTRDTVDSYLKLVASLTQANSVEEAIELGKTYSEKTQESVKELALDLSGILSNAVESNVSLIKDAVSAEQPAKKAPARKKPVAKKAAVKPAATAAA